MTEELETPQEKTLQPAFMGTLSSGMRAFFWLLPQPKPLLKLF